MRRRTWPVATSAVSLLLASVVFSPGVAIAAPLTSALRAELVRTDASPDAVAAAAQSNGLPAQALTVSAVATPVVVTRDSYTVTAPPPPPPVVKAVAPKPEPEPETEPELAPAPSPRPAVISNPTGSQAIAADAVAARGWGSDEFDCLVALWNKESGWRTDAGNQSSGAYGIPQSLPGSKMASAGADWETNPATQISWGLTYISGRYTAPCGAWDHSESRGWY